MKNKLFCVSQQWFIFCLALFLLSACTSAPKSVSTQSTHASSSKAKAPTTTTTTTSTKSNNSANLPKANSGKGGYYLDDGPGEDIPVNLESTIDPIPVVEPYSRSGNKPYTVFGKTYTPLVDTTTPFKQRGFASWYGKKFHGKRTSSGEKYDMYKITAAHPTLPIPSYARVTNLSNGKQIIVRINDRGPFHSSRVMDLSYTAALKLDYLAHGRAEVEVERLLPDDIAKMAENPSNKDRPQSNSDDKHAFEDLIAVTASSDSKGKSQSQSQNHSQSESKELKPVNTLSTQPELLSTTITQQGIYLQYAAFGLLDNANASLEQLQSVLAPYLAGKPLEVIQQGALYRIQSGPYTSREQALQFAEKVTMGGAKPIVVVR